MDVLIYEPIYADGQELRDPSFVPLPVDNSRKGWREFAIMVDFYRRGMHRGPGVKGVFSPKFQIKAGIPGEQALQFVRDRPGADVYLMNPGPDGGVLWFNIWENGEQHHHGLLTRAQALLDKVGIPWDLANEPRHGPDVWVFCNFWLGTEAFWDAYVGGILVPIAEYIEQHPTDDAVRGIMELAAYRVPVPFLPFMVERMFTTFLRRHLAEWKTTVWHRSPTEAAVTLMTRHLVEYLEPMVAKGDREGFSPELRELMRFCSAADKLYNEVYFSIHVHPQA